MKGEYASRQRKKRRKGAPSATYDNPRQMIENKMLKDIVSLSKCEQLVLAILEEAGEEHVSALANSVETGLNEALPSARTLSVALIRLIERGLVRVARTRNVVRRLIPLSVGESISVASALESVIERSPTDRLWHWKGNEPAEVVLTDAGLTLAREILRANGWPPWQPGPN